ncbi:hypothetical protein OAA19_01790 [Rubripirellula sp.]|nr:hypothetical protein [Rubripirellula sp.]MDB4338819.1 hypothetical protein [Rubripirellula sp.]
MKRFSLLLVLLIAGSFAVIKVLPKSGGDLSIESLLTYPVEIQDLTVSITEQGTLESANNTEIKCRVRGENTVTFVIESGKEVKAGDLLVQLETLAIEEEISERTKFFYLAESSVARSGADVQRAKISIREYEEGRFITDLSSLKKERAIAEANLVNATNRLNHFRMLERSDYASERQVEERLFAREQATLDVALRNTRIAVLEDYTKKEELINLRGELNAAEATHEANLERALADKQRLDRANEELRQCTILAERDGLVIYPDSEQWKDTPEIEEGATVRKDQTILLMPDLKKMQIKVGIHESMVDRMSEGMTANVTLNQTSITGNITYVASVAQPAGWWTGNVVKYDSVVSLPTTENLRPGMSAEVEIILAQYPQSLTLPTNACVETQDGFSCWIRDNGKIIRRDVELGDSNEMFIIVKSGLQRGDEIILDPLGVLPEAQRAAVASDRSDDDSPFGYEDL